MSNPVSIRLLSQQLVAPQFAGPEELVSHFGAMQAQDCRMMRWAVAMRTRKASASMFKAAYDSGRIVRLHMLRGTWQLVAAEDYRWMQDLCSAKARAVISGWMSANRISIPASEYAAVRAIVMDEAERLGSITKEDAALALARKDIVMDDHRLSYHLRMAELDSDLCSGDLLPMKASYSPADSKVPRTAPITRDEALSRLCRKYFQSHSPATLEDFAWWSGMGLTDCRRGIAMLGGELHRVKTGGKEFLVHESCRTRGFRKGCTLLIPPYDEYLIGYKSRALSLPSEHRHKAHNNSGIFYPVIAHDGIICGNWTPHGKDAGATLFDGSAIDVSAEWQAYRKHMQR